VTPNGSRSAAIGANQNRSSNETDDAPIGGCIVALGRLLLVSIQHREIQVRTSLSR